MFDVRKYSSRILYDETEDITPCSMIWIGKRIPCSLMPIEAFSDKYAYAESFITKD